MSHEIQNISPTTENAILRKSAYGLPNRPSESGMRADDIKKAFYSAVTDDNDSVLSEIKRIVGESNEIFKSIDNEKEESDKKTEDNTKDLNEIKNNISQLSNPNLLINGDFRVNQRGQTSYNGTAIYTIDRWESREPSLTIQPLNDFGVKLIKSSINRKSTISMAQAIEDYKHLLGKTITLSCKYKNNNVSGGFQVGLYTSDRNEYASQALTSQYFITNESGIYSETITLPQQLDYSLLQVLFRLSNTAVENQSVEIEYVKLEIGSVATAFSPRPYAEELALCQRYFFINNNNGYTYNQTGVGMVMTATRVDFHIPTPVQMIGLPTITYNGETTPIELYFIKGNAVFELSNLVSSRINANELVLTGTGSGLTVNEFGFLRAGATTKVKMGFDAEIY